jgi:hypothetical protein
MTILTTTCDRCDVPLSVPTSAVLLAETADGSAEMLGWLVCAACDDLVPLRIPGAVAVSLARAGSHVVTPARAVPHPEQRPGGPVLSADDALALHELLADDEALDEALRGVASAGS